jgi:hypothetical protein
MAKIQHNKICAQTCGETQTPRSKTGPHPEHSYKNHSGKLRRKIETLA